MCLRCPESRDENGAALMELSLNEDQTQILDFIDSLTKPYATAVLHGTGFALTSDALDAELVEGGFLDVMAIEELGAVTAAMVVERLARLPYALEVAFSALVRPLLDADLPRPICLVEEGKLSRPVRFLKPGATVVRESSDEALFAYPLAFLTEIPADLRNHDAAPDAILAMWRVALAAEASGLLAAALASVVTYISERKQFGRPLATFQALRHRMAEAQVVTNGVYWLTMKAASSGDAGDAALAALHAQEAARRVVYDYHQFLGGMGMTLEHPLHLWTYRLKALIGELGGRGANGLAAAKAIWG
jgi:hypothetical protein